MPIIRIPVTIATFTGPPAVAPSQDPGVISRRTDVTPDRYYLAVDGAVGAGVDLGAMAYGFMDLENSAIAILVPPGQYSPSPETIGDEGVGYGAINAVINAPRTLWGFTLTVQAGWWGLPWCLEQLQAIATATTGTRGALTVWDGGHVRPLDAAQGYTVREMQITQVAPQGGAIVQDGELWYPGGWTATFRELDPDTVTPTQSPPGWEATVWG